MNVAVTSMTSYSRADRPSARTGILSDFIMVRPIPVLLSPRAVSAVFSPGRIRIRVQLRDAIFSVLVGMTGKKGQYESFEP